MSQITTIFWDVGGVLLSNAWDREQRQRALAHFHLDETDFQDRHEMVVSSFERGKLTLDEYLQRTIFCHPCQFTREAFKNFMFSLSQPDTGTLALAQQLASSGKYLMSTINNESKDLNLYRIQSFNLREICTLFVSSCFVGLRKPEEAIYRLALDMTQKPPEQCCFIDDRPLNLESASQLGMHTIRKENAEQLREDLGKMGVIA